MAPFEFQVCASFWRDGDLSSSCARRRPAYWMLLTAYPITYPHTLRSLKLAYALSKKAGTAR